jgi:predicted nucleic acid-binding protein
VTRVSLEAEIRPGDVLVLDSSALLAYLSGRERASAPAATILDEFVRRGRNPGLVSVVSMTEILVRPFRTSDAAVGEVEAFLTVFPGLELVSVDPPLAREAASIRARTGLRSPDALVIATAIRRDAEVVVANDERWRSAIVALGNPVVLCHLDAHA